MTRVQPLSKHGASEAARPFMEAAKARFNDAHLVELAATAAMENYRSRLNRTFLVEIQGDYKGTDA